MGMLTEFKEFAMRGRIFLVIKAMNALNRKKSAASSAPPAPSTQEVLLTEIRDAILGRQ